MDTELTGDTANPSTPSGAANDTKPPEKPPSDDSEHWNYIGQLMKEMPPWMWMLLGY